MLISAGANVNAKGSNDSTPLIVAANGGHVSIAKLLLKQTKVNVHEQVHVCVICLNTLQLDGPLLLGC